LCKGGIFIKESNAWSNCWKLILPDLIVQLLLVILFIQEIRQPFNIRPTCRTTPGAGSITHAAASSQPTAIFPPLPQHAAVAPTGGKNARGCRW